MTYNLKKTEKGLKYTIGVFAATSLTTNADGTFEPNFGTTSILEDCYLSNIGWGGTNVESRKIDDLSAENMWAEFEAGEITPPQIDVTFIATESPPNLISSLSEEAGFLLKLVISRDGSACFTGVGILTQDVAVTLQSRQSVSGNFKIQIVKTPTFS